MGPLTAIWGPKMAKGVSKQAKALELWRKGSTAATIAKKLGYTSEGAALKACVKELAKAPATTVQQQRAIERERLDLVAARVMISALDGDALAAKQLLDIQRRREELAAAAASKTGPLVEAVQATAKACEGLEAGGADAALVRACLKIAEHVDNIDRFGTAAEQTKARYLIPHLTNMLREMGATPAARAAREAGKAPEKSKLAQMQQARDRLRAV